MSYPDDIGMDHTEGFAKVCRQFYNNLIREGFTEAEAMELVKAFIKRGPK